MKIFELSKARNCSYFTVWENPKTGKYLITDGAATDGKIKDPLGDFINIGLAAVPIEQLKELGSPIAPVEYDPAINQIVVTNPKFKQLVIDHITRFSMLEKLTKHIKEEWQLTFKPEYN